VITYGQAFPISYANTGEVAHCYRGTLFSVAKRCKLTPDDESANPWRPYWVRPRFRFTL
jgi:hypothetical protein